MGWPIPALARAAGRCGVEIVEQAEVVEIGVERGAVHGVRTRSLDVAAPHVVNAAGTWAGRVARLAGIEVPITQARRQLYVTGPVAALPPSFPLIVDYHHGWYGRREGAGVLVSGVLRPAEGFSLAPDPGETSRALQEAEARIPALKGAKAVRSWVGLYDNTPDNHAILGEAPEVRGLYIAAGFSGHGFMHGPAAGRVVAELIVEGKATALDITLLRPERFREGRLTQEPLTMHGDRG
ncbi:MAG: FAD-binding oxidoreductase [Deltaproteobacteria bacterium]|nr:FAD-binding oxidoreductase [Deltaproteobacteria bacterium]